MQLWLPNTMNTSNPNHAPVTKFQPLSKYLQHNNLAASLAQAEDFIKSGRVFVNGVAVTNPICPVTDTQKIEVRPQPEDEAEASKTADGSTEQDL
jgi:predicted rRNA methylase YqxC with S4 and FtsJ domains